MFESTCLLGFVSVGNYPDLQFICGGLKSADFVEGSNLGVVWHVLGCSVQDQESVELFAVF